MPNDFEFDEGFKYLSKNFSTQGKRAEYTKDQQEIIKDAFRGIALETWQTMIRTLIETQTYLPRTNAFYKAKNDIEESGGKERSRVPCNICDGEGLIAAIGKFSDMFPRLCYVRNYRCSCGNGINNWSKKIAFRKNAADERIEEWCKQREIPAALAKYSEEPAGEGPLVVSVNEDRYPKETRQEPGEVAPGGTPKVGPII